MKWILLTVLHCLIGDYSAVSFAEMRMHWGFVANKKMDELPEGLLLELKGYSIVLKGGEDYLSSKYALLDPQFSIHLDESQPMTEIFSFKIGKLISKDTANKGTAKYYKPTYEIINEEGGKFGAIQFLMSSNEAYKGSMEYSADNFLRDLNLEIGMEVEKTVDVVKDGTNSDGELKKSGD